MLRPRLRTNISPREIARYYLAGHSLAETAALAKVSTGIIRRILIELDVPRRSRGAPKGSTWNGLLTVRRREQLRADVRSGKFPTQRAIARKYGVSHEYVRQIAAAEGVTRYRMEFRLQAARERQRQRQATAAAARAAREAAREARRMRIAKMYQGGASLREIGRALGVGMSTASTVISNYRKQFPSGFPRRHAQRCTPAEERERERAQAARAAARRERIETRRTILADLWRVGATTAEIASVFGVSVAAVHTMFSRHRKRYPADFPPSRPLARQERGGRPRASARRRPNTRG